MVEEKFKAAPIYIVPIFANLLVSVFCAFLISQSQVELAPATILPETNFGPLFNAAIFVCASGLGATIMYLLLKFGVHHLIRFMMGIAFSVVTFLLVVLYSEFALIILNLNVSLVAILIFAASITAFVIVKVFFKRGWCHETIVLVFGGGTGTLLGASIPTLSAVTIMLSLSVYDVIAVFRGPIGKIASRELKHLPGATFAFKKIHLGLGDLTFYSMLVSHMFLNFGWLACTAATLGVLIGSFLSLKMVEKKGMFPGLPFSVLFGLLLGFAASTWT